jgi:hypothetical protein
MRVAHRYRLSWQTQVHLFARQAQAQGIRRQLLLALCQVLLDGLFQPVQFLPHLAPVLGI